MVIFDVVTIFPEQIRAFTNEGVFHIAQEKGLALVQVHNLRKWSKGKYRHVDDKPYGGGAGMVLMVEPFYKAVNELRQEDTEVIMMSPKGEILDQEALWKVITALPSVECYGPLREIANNNVIKGETSKDIAKASVNSRFKGEPISKFQSKLESQAICFTKRGHFIILCGHYEGFDERIRKYLIDKEISVGNYVLSGGELPALVFMDGLIRLLPGVLGNTK